MTSVESKDDAGRSYVFDQAWQQEQERLDAIETIWDPTSVRHFEALGVSEGWRCLEVGAGGGSLAERLCERVGPTGRVVATDLDTRFLEAIDAPNLDVLRHNICTDDLTQARFDLVHCRLLLEHLPKSDAALDRMIAALKPGGRLLVEEFDHTSFLPDPNAQAEAQEAWGSFLAAFTRLAEQRGIDLLYGRRLSGLLSAHGLIDTGAEGRTVVERGGAGGRGLLRLSIASMRPQLIATGEIDAAGVDRMMTLLDDPRFSWTSQIMVSAWGTKA